MKTPRQSLFMLCFALLLPVSLHAESPIDRRSAPVLIVTEDFPPYNYTENGKVSGLSTALVERVMTQAGLPYRIELMPWSRAYTIATMPTDQNVLIYTLTRTPEREEHFDWLVRLSDTAQYLMGRLSQKLLTLDELKQGPYQAVCIINDASCEALRSVGFVGDRLTTLSDTALASQFRMVLANRADFFAANLVYLPYRLKQFDISVSAFQKIVKIDNGVGYYLAASKRCDISVREKIRAAVLALEQAGEPVSIEGI